MNKLIILRGNSGSGKTTVAGELQKRFGNNTLLISQDTVRRCMLRTGDGKDTPALPLLKTLLQYGKAHCGVVILEGILIADWYRPLFETAKELFGSEIYAYYFDIPFEETVKRHQTRPECREFDEKAMRDWWKEKDYSDVLNEVSITADQDKESIVREIYETVSHTV